MEIHPLPLQTTGLRGPNLVTYEVRLWPFGSDVGPTWPAPGHDEGPPLAGPVRGPEGDGGGGREAGARRIESEEPCPGKRLEFEEQIFRNIQLEMEIRFLNPTQRFWSKLRVLYFGGMNAT